MSGTRSASGTATVTTADVENVVRRAGADMRMIAESTRGWDTSKTANYIHDVEELAKAGYLKHVDLTLFSDGVEVKATRFVVSADASGWVSERPGQAMWPRVTNPRLRIILSHTNDYDATARAKMARNLKIDWVACHDDTSHQTLKRGGGRTYASNAYGMQRQDWAA